MSVIPNRKFSIKTSKTKEEIHQIVTSNTLSKRPSLFSSSPKKPFWGRATDNCFIIVPVINYSNSFVPMIKLCITENDEGTVVNIKMRPLTGVIAFMCIWLVMCAISELIFFAIFSKQGFSFFDIIPAALFTFGYWMMHFGFRLEADKAKKLLRDMLGDTPYQEEDRTKRRDRKKLKKSINTALKILAVPIALVGFYGFCMGVALGNDEVSKFYVQHPLNEKCGIAADSDGNIYVGESETGSIQVYNKQGVFQYGFGFPTGGSGSFAFGIDDDKIHLVTAREDSYLVFDKGVLISEEIIDNDRSQELQKTYNMTNGFYCTCNNADYMISTFNTVTIEDKSGNLIEKFRLKKVPIWPFPIMIYWMMAAVGSIPFFALVFKTVVLTSKKPTK
jgi:hypothetical protein